MYKQSCANAEYVTPGSPVPFRRWLIVTQYYPPEPGAPQVRLSAFARELAKKGCEVDVLTAMPNYPEGIIYPEFRGCLLREEVLDGIPVRRQWLFPAAGRNPIRRLLCYGSFTAGAMLRAPVLARPDVIFVEAQPITLAMAGYLTGLLRSVPYIYNTPDLQVEVAGEAGWLSSAGLLRAAGVLEKFLMKRALCVATVTDAFIEHFHRTYSIPLSRLTFLPNGADTKMLHPSLYDEDYARQMGVPGKTVFTYAGTHAHYQGLELLLEAALLLRDREDIAILMVGSGPLREPLKQRAADLGLTNMLFRESPFSDMVRLMSLTRASIATIADMKIATKMRLSKVIPPLACGVPVIYAGEGESAQILEQNGCGCVVNPRTPEGLAGCIRSLADAPELCRAMGARGRALAVQEFSWEGIVDRWLSQVGAIVRGSTA